MAGRDRRGDSASLFSSTRDKFGSTCNVSPYPDCSGFSAFKPLSLVVSPHAQPCASH